ncbi:uncharacterized protein [Aegilops tauschii subsp. strangulata]|uniref:uncharacterized protein n=1 Tax=Aegilops tauschii subsp. strangulata TaxID=200361 RepID=UPI003CC86A09
MSGEVWILTNIYGPCQGEARERFLDWFKHIYMPDDMQWIIMGDFNYIRYPSNMSRSGGNFSDMLRFNEAINALALVEIPLKGRSFTWTNMQTAPLLEKLDWVFTFEAWTSQYPHTVVLPLAKPVSDHIPCLIQIGTHIPKANTFRFENYWLQIQGFEDIVKQNWESTLHIQDSANRITAKFKRLRKSLKIWARSISQLSSTIRATNEVILFFHTIEDFRTLTDVESNGRNFLKQHLMHLLQLQKIYWQQRATIRWVKFGEANSQYFKAKATIKCRVNHIDCLHDELGNSFKDHSSKANILHHAFKKRLNTSVPTFNPLNLESLLHTDVDFSMLEIPFSEEEIDNVIKELPPDKAPGPDGFNTNFVKHCCDIIASDFYALIEDFYHGRISLQSIKSSFITLIPKRMLQ